MIFLLTVKTYINKIYIIFISIQCFIYVLFYFLLFNVIDNNIEFKSAYFFEISF
jgi:hypothetical protein